MNEERLVASRPALPRRQLLSVLAAGLMFGLGLVWTFSERVQSAILPAPHDATMIDLAWSPGAQTHEEIERTLAVLDRRLRAIDERPAFETTGPLRAIIRLRRAHSPEEIETLRAAITQEGSLAFLILAEPRDPLDLEAESTRFRLWLDAEPETPVADYVASLEARGEPPPAVAWFPPTTDADRYPLDLEHAVDGFLPTLRQVERPSWVFRDTDLRHAGPGLDRYGQPAIRFEFREERTEAFEAFTAAYTHRSLAIVLDGVIMAAPNIGQALPGGGIIEGGRDGYTVQEMRAWIAKLGNGRVPAPPHVRWIGPANEPRGR